MLEIRNGEDEALVPSFLSGNLTGGVGKTTMTRIIAYMYSMAGLPLRVVSIEEGSPDRLAKLIDGLEHVRLEPSAREVADFGGDTLLAGTAHWDPIGDRLAGGGQLLDFGANSIQRFLDWVESAQPRDLLEDAPVLNVLVPVVSTGNSAVEGLGLLRRFERLEPVFMKLRLVAVYNGYTGSVSKSDNPSVVELRSYVERKRIPVVTIERGSIGVADTHSFIELATAKARDFAAATGDTPMSANGKLKFFTAWLAQSIASAEAAGLGPKGAD